MNPNFEQRMKDTVKFFADNNFPMSELIKRGKKQGLTEAQIRAGMIRVYEKVQKGEKVKPIRYAWNAWNEAKNIQQEVYSVLDKTRWSLKEQIETLVNSRDRYRIIAMVGWLVALIFAVQAFWGILWK